MPTVIGVRFKQACKIYYFAPGNLEITTDDIVIVQTSRGYEAGEVAIGPHEVSDDEIVGQLKEVTRIANTEDLLSQQRYRMHEPSTLKKCQEKVLEYDLPMKVVAAEYSFDGSSLVFFFTADKRVDFRELVRELARTFRTRIELRQIGVRDEAKLIGGIGPCGRPLCCITYLTDFKPVSIRMAKQQNLPLSPMEISGLCGRLLCCLSYENDYYKEARKAMPRIGSTYPTEHGEGRVVDVNVIRQVVQVQLDLETTVEVPWLFPDEREELAEQEEQPVLEQVQPTSPQADDRDTSRAQTPSLPEEKPRRADSQQEAAPSPQRAAPRQAAPQKPAPQKAMPKKPAPKKTPQKKAPPEESLEQESLEQESLEQEPTEYAPHLAPARRRSSRKRSRRKSSNRTP